MRVYWEFLNLVQAGKINWQGISALLTLLAVIVALLPTFKERRRKRKLVHNLRIRLLSNLVVLRSLIGRHLGIEKSTLQLMILSDGERRAIYSLDAMSSELIILKPEEHDSIMRFMPDVKELDADPVKAIKRFNKDSLDSLNQIIETLGNKVNDRSAQR